MSLGQGSRCKGSKFKSPGLRRQHLTWCLVFVDAARTLKLGDLTVTAARPSAFTSAVCADREDSAKKGRPLPSHANSTTLLWGKPWVALELLSVDSTA